MMSVFKRKYFLYLFIGTIFVSAIGTYFYFHKSPPKIILIGLDGADWDIIDSYIAQGKLPHFKHFKTEGTWGRLKSYSPTLSPVIWTTLATGKSPDEHGIVDFLVWDEIQKTRIPVTQNLVKSIPIWDILSQHGVKVGVFNWLVSWPAQKVKGVLVSDRLGYHIFPQIVGDRLKVEKLCYPDDYVFKRRHLLTSPAEITYEEAMPFVHIPQGEFEASYVKGKYDIKNPQYNLRMILASLKTMARLALEKVERHQPDFLALYFDSPDTMMHTYMDYAPPKLSRVSQKDFDKYKDAVEQTYVYLDKIVGDFLKEADPNTLFILVSDHGFKFGKERIERSAQIGEKAEERWHDMEGIVAFLGAPFPKAKEIKGVDVYDVLPTLLYMYDLPLAEDMKGKIMTSAFKEDYFTPSKIRYVATYEKLKGDGKREEVIHSKTEDAVKERLVSLGYVNQGELVSATASAPSKNKTTPHSKYDTRNPFLEAYHLEEAGKKEEAIGRYEEILKKNPDTKNAHAIYNQLALLYKEKGNVRRALKNIEKAIQRLPSLSSLYVNKGNILRDFNRWPKALKAYETALSLNAKDFMAYYNLGYLYESQGKWRKAKDAYEKALELNETFDLAKVQLLKLIERYGTDEEQKLVKSKLLNSQKQKGNIDAYLVEAQALIQKKEYESALRILKKAQSIEPQNAILFNDMGGIYLAQSKYDEAISAFKKVLEKDPGYSLAYMNLGVAYQQTKQWKESKEHLIKASHLDPRKPVVYYLLGVAEINLNEKEAAKDHFKKALELKKDFVAAQNMLEKLSR